MYRSRLWTMRMFAGFGTAEDDQRSGSSRLLDAGGSTGLSTAFDLPTLMGRDSDDDIVARRGRQGRRGHRHPRPTWSDLFAGIDLEPRSPPR